MIASPGLVVVVVVLHIKGRILRHLLRYAACQGVGTVLIVFGPLGVQGHASPAADSDNPNLFRVHIFPQGEIIHRRLKILCVDIRGSHIPGLTAALSGKGGVKGHRQKSPFRHSLGVQARGLLFYRAEGAAHGNGCQSALCVLWLVDVRRQGDAVAVVEGHFAVLHLVALGK